MNNTRRSSGSRSNPRKRRWGWGLLGVALIAGLALELHGGHQAPGVLAQPAPQAHGAGERTISPEGLLAPSGPPDVVRVEEQAPAPLAQPTLIRVVAQVDGAPVPEAAIHVVWRGGETHLNTAADGSATVPVRGILALEVSASGFLPWKQVLLAEESITVPLSRGGRLEVFVGGDLNWSSPLRVCLLPPVANGHEWQVRNWHSSLGILQQHPDQFPHDWFIRSVAGSLTPADLVRQVMPGQSVVWPALPGGQPWRIAVVDGPPTAFTPTPGATSIFREDGAIAFTDELRRKTGSVFSGEFEITEHATVQVQAQLLSHGEVVGRLAAKLVGRVAELDVRLHQNDLWENPYGGPEYTNLWQEGHLEGAADLARGFSFPAVLPGAKTLRARWITTDGSIGVTHRMFTVPAGESIDLGEIGGEWNTQFQVTVIYLDSRGQRIAHEEVLSSAPSGAPGFSFYPVYLYGEDDWMATLEVLPGQVATLQGMPPGHYRVELGALSPALQSPWIPGPRTQEISTLLSDGAVIEIPVRIRRSARATVVAAWPPAAKGPSAAPRGRYAGHLVCDDGHGSMPFNIESRYGPDAKHGLTAYPGTWRAWGTYCLETSASTIDGAQVDADPGWCLDPAPFEIGADNRASVTLTPIRAAALAILLLDEHGLPQAGVRKCIYPTDYSNAGCGTWSATSDEAGILHFRGLPPNTEWAVNMRGHPTVRSGAAGSISNVQASCAPRREH
ncbi:MAG: hypothetical protein QF599_10785 [Planctomycetota bacterium]|nr:hypothetical protein [Planctomycetota bacterium]